MNWIFLNSSQQDAYINMLANSVGASVTDYQDFDYANTTAPLVIRGILKHKLIHRCIQDRRLFYFVDTGYFDNLVAKASAKRPKLYHRIVANDLQHCNVQQRPSDRWQQLKIPIASWKKDGSKILITVPDEKPCKFYGISSEAWLSTTLDTLRKHTDRPIEIRHRVRDRGSRIIKQNLAQALNNDVYALVTYNSNSATEAILQGIPAFVTAPTHAAQWVACRDLTQIERPYYPDSDQVYQWACWLAYGQFHVKELANGRAIRILNEFG